MKDAFVIIREDQGEAGYNETVIDGTVIGKKVSFTISKADAETAVEAALKILRKNRQK